MSVLTTGRTASSRTIPWREKRREEQHKIYTARKEDVRKELPQILGAFKKKASARLKVFYAESLRVDEKVPLILDRVHRDGFKIEAMTFNAALKEILYNSRKRVKPLSINIGGSRDGRDFCGTLTISPASAKLSIIIPSLKRPTTKNGFLLPTYQINFYRTLVVTDNYLACLVAGPIKKSSDW